jgi:hypothetical protein
MAVIAEKPNPLPQNCARLCVGLHISTAGSESSASSPSLTVESFESPPPSLWPLGLCCPQTQTPQRRVHCIHTMP